MKTFLTTTALAMTLAGPALPTVFPGGEACDARWNDCGGGVSFAPAPAEAASPADLAPDAPVKPEPEPEPEQPDPTPHPVQPHDPIPVEPAGEQEGGE